MFMTIGGIVMVVNAIAFGLHAGNPNADRFSRVMDGTLGIGCLVVAGLLFNQA